MIFSGLPLVFSWQGFSLSGNGRSTHIGSTRGAKMVITLLTLLGLVFLGMAAFNVSFPRLNSLGAGLFLICLAQYGPTLLSHLH